MRILLAGIPLLLCTTSALAAPPLPLEAQRVAPPVQILHLNKKLPLLPKRQLEPADRIITGRNGRAALLLENAGQLVLGDDSELYIHSAEPSAENHGALARMALMRGSLRMDSTARPNKLPQDMRLNVGILRVRVYGSEVWANVEPGQSQTVCLLQGSVEILSDVGNELLDNPGDCFRYGNNNVRMKLRPDTDATLARKLSRTAFAGETVPGTPPVTVAAPVDNAMPPTPIMPTAEIPVAAAPVLPALPPAPAPVVAPAPPAPVVAISEPLPAPAADVEVFVPPAPATAPSAASWTVVVATVKSEAGAAREAARLLAKGYAAQVQRSDKGLYRVCVGHFGSRDLAKSYAMDIKKKEKLPVWVEPDRETIAVSAVAPAASPAPAAPAPEPVASVAAVEAPPAPPASAPSAADADAVPGFDAAPLPAAPAPAPSRATADGSGKWTVVVASVKSEDAANKEAARLNARGLVAEVTRSNTGFYRVCIGRFSTREMAQAYSLELREREKLQAWVSSN